MTIAYSVEELRKEVLMPYNILCIDDDPEFLLGLKLQLKKNYTIKTALTLQEGIQSIREETTDLVLLDIGLGQEDGMDGLRQIKQINPSIDVVMVTGYKDPKFIIQAIRNNAADYLCKPFELEELIAIIEKLQAIKSMRDRHDALIANLNPVDTRARLLGNSAVFRNLLEQANRVKGHMANILIQGESGTGKELLARYIHSLEENPQRPFIAVNCSAIPEGLIESELFGHERGSFTGALQRKIGKFELASSGDIFLDEISTLKMDLQVKILRVLQEREIVRVGGNIPIRVDFRVISATNENLEAKTDRNEFRMDLFHRLRVIQLQIPPLRERKEDIPLLVAYFLEKYGRAAGKKRITAEALRRLQNYYWPGNIRELENVVHSVVILSPSDIISEDHLPTWTMNSVLKKPVEQEQQESTPLIPSVSGEITLKDYVKQAEKIYIEHMLSTHKGDKTKAAEAMDVGRTTLYGKLKELGLQ